MPKNRKLIPAVAPKSATKVEHTHGPKVCRDFNGHTCIEVSRDDDKVYYIPLDVEEGLQLKKYNDQVFSQIYSPIPNYPVERAAKRYAAFAQTHGATKEAMRALAGFITITNQEIDMAAKKKVSKSAPAKAEKQPAEKKETAAQMFKDLIMEGKLTDDQIFAKVKAKFKLDDNKRGYVPWYRNYLVKKGEKVPAKKS